MVLLAISALAAAQGEGKKRSDQDTLAEKGKAFFLSNCSFCHGRDAGGGESGPDLTRSKLVSGDVAGDKIGPMVRDGRPQSGMPPFPVSQQQILELAAFLQKRRADAELHPGGRRGVDIADLQSGNAEAGKRYFNGVGRCAFCHSPTGDLSGVATRYSPLELEERMLYPGTSRAYLNYSKGELHPRAASKVTITISSEESVTGTLAYDDGFTIALIDELGWYRSWPASKVKYVIHAAAEVHLELLGKYTDDDIHNLMAYLQTLR